MRLFWMTVPKPLDSAVGACRGPLAPAGPSARATILSLAPTIAMIEVHDRMIPT